MKKNPEGPAALSRRVRYGVSAFFVLYLLLTVLGWLAPAPAAHGSLGDAGMYELLLQLQSQPFERLAAMPLWQRCLGLALALPALLVLGDAVRQLAVVLRQFEQGVFFTPQVAQRFRRFAGGLLLGTVLTLLEPTVRGMLFGLLDEGTSQLRLVIDITGGDLWTLLLCTVFLALAQILHEGQRLADENSGFI
ncbi:hypothetical protein [Janthinobacterium lividum]|uniref:hypothetical protein n=1 Tax=Janthinobacterium lividum TaxID=29581 RepID=UPI000537D7BC|nr:hypothetical protein [Janthinobacterium lividum]KHA80499.1 hypothetical protein NC77_01630 [Janthinobacterium lividum]QKY06928.1 hypothetical protein G8765_03500 [Janthinobacterium lividum]